MIRDSVPFFYDARLEGLLEAFGDPSPPGEGFIGPDHTIVIEGCGSS
jgi:hypothetical protein